MDIIEDDESISLLLLPKGSKSLRKTLAEQQRSDASKIEFARQTIRKLSEIVDKIYQKRVMHRSINLDCVMMDCRDEVPKVSSIQDFDTSNNLKNR